MTADAYKLFQWDDGNSKWVRGSGTDLLAKTADYTVTAAELHGTTIFTNTGDVDALNLTLPAGAADYSFFAYITVAQYLRFTANGSEKFRFMATQSAAGGYVRAATIGNWIGGAWMGSEWGIIDIGGVWTFDE